MCCDADPVVLLVRLSFVFGRRRCPTKAAYAPRLPVRLSSPRMRCAACEASECQAVVGALERDFGDSPELPGIRAQCSLSPAFSGVFPASPHSLGPHSAKRLRVRKYIAQPCMAAKASLGSSSEVDLHHGRRETRARARRWPSSKPLPRHPTNLLDLAGRCHASRPISLAERQRGVGGPILPISSSLGLWLCFESRSPSPGTYTHITLCPIDLYPFPPACSLRYLEKIPEIPAIYFVPITRLGLCFSTALPKLHNITTHPSHGGLRHLESPGSTSWPR